MDKFEILGIEQSLHNEAYNLSTPVNGSSLSSDLTVARALPDSTLSLSESETLPRHTMELLGKDNLLPAIEAILDPTVLAASILMIGIDFEGRLLSDYLILSVLVFAITFPGTSHLQSSLGRMMSGVFISWILIASTLLLLGFVSKDLDEFSKPALITWLWAAPLCQIGARLALRAVAPYLVQLQGAPQRAIIVGMNEQGMALASRIGTTEYSGIELSGFFDDRDQERLDNTEDLSAIGNLK